MNLKWGKNYKTGNIIIDYQHKKLVKLISSLKKITEENREFALLKIFDFLTKYTKYHFNYEETYQLKNNYRNYDRHKKLHNDLLEVVHLIQLDKITIEELYDILSKWLANHILVEDKNMVSIIKDSKRKFLK